MDAQSCSTLQILKELHKCELIGIASSAEPLLIPDQFMRLKDDHHLLKDPKERVFSVEIIQCVTNNQSLPQKQRVS